MKTLVLLLSSLVLLASTAHGESIYLKDGKVVHGTILEEDANTILLETCETQRIDKSAVESVKKDEQGLGVSAAALEKSRAKKRPLETVVKLGADVAGRNSFSNVSITGTNLVQKSDSNIDTGISVAAEEILYVLPTVGVGAGIAYVPTRQEPLSGGRFSFIPIYGLVRVRSTPTGDNHYAFATAHLGYNYFVANKEYASAGNFEMTNGAYAGLGGGYVFGRVQVEALYTIDQGRLSGNDNDAQNSHYTISADAVYRKITLSVGFLF